MPENLREYAKTFASLRAAQRALARCLHPARVSAARESGRQILIELQSVGASASDESEGDESTRAERIQRIGNLLKHQLGSTLEIVADLEFSQLRATGPKLCQQYPEEARALIDVMLLGDLANGDSLRILEYLITMVCTEEWNGRRSLIHEPARLTPGLRALSSRIAAEAAGSAAGDIEKLENAIASLGRGEDHYSIRNEMRAYKHGLGVGIFRPEIISRVIAYNVAMYNQVAAGVDASMAIDELADELLSELKSSDDHQSVDKVGRIGSAKNAGAKSDMLASGEFACVVEAFCTRVRGEASADLPARRIVGAFELGGLTLIELEALEAQDVDATGELIRKAIVLSQIIRCRSDVEDDLALISIDLQLLETQSLKELSDQMTAVAKKLFAESRCDEAFGLSELKTRNLAALGESALRRFNQEMEDGARATEEQPGAEGAVLGRSRGGVHARAEESARIRSEVGLAPGRVVLVLAVLACIGLFASWLPDWSRPNTFSTADLASLSPFIESGERREVDGRPHFIGRLGASWGYLGTRERRAVAAQIAGRLNVAGIEDFSLSNARREVLVAWRAGMPVDVVAKPYDD